MTVQIVMVLDDTQATISVAFLESFLYDTLEIKIYIFCSYCLLGKSILLIAEGAKTFSQLQNQNNSTLPNKHQSDVEVIKSLVSTLTAADLREISSLILSWKEKRNIKVEFLGVFRSSPFYSSFTQVNINSWRLGIPEDKNESRGYSIAYMGLEAVHCVHVQICATGEVVEANENFVPFHF